MADITSSTYAVVTETKAGDLIAVVRGGNLKKLTLAALLSTATDSAVTELRQGGPTADRPAGPDSFEMYFDTTLGKPIWWSGLNWVDATGATV